MSKRSSPRNKPQNASQPSTSTGRTRSRVVSSSSSSGDSEDDYDPSPSSTSSSTQNTPSVNDRSGSSEISQDKEFSLVGECAFYLLVNDQRKHVIKKSDIVKNVLKEHRKHFKPIMEKVAEYLKKVAGVQLEEMPENKGCYMLVNEMEKANAFATNSYFENAKRGLMAVVLSVIFMKQGLVREADMWKALAKVGIDPDLKHPVFGDVKKMLTQELPRQMYLEYKKENIDPPVFSFSWGPRARSEVSKLEVLKFVCNIFGDMTIDQWPNQMNEAMGADPTAEPER